MARRWRAAAGFTLIEALVATALMGMVLAALATITAQWLPNWNRGIGRVQRTELVSISLNRLIADLEAAEFIAPNRGTKLPLFDGTASSVIFVRSVLGPSPRPGLEIVRFAEVPDGRTTALVRATMPFVPTDPNTPLAAQLKFANPVALLRAPYRVTFAYQGRDGIWMESWQNAIMLPTAIRLTVRDAATQRALAISTTALVHVDLPAACAGAKEKADCVSKPDQPNTKPDDGPEPPPAPVQRGDLSVSRSAS
jgi:general secretion pathway protein J